MIRPAVSIKFQCVCTSPFHTTQRKYQNLLKCAPYILGTTIRGSILGFLIQKYCTDEKIVKLKKMQNTESIVRFHRECKKECIVKEIYQNLDDIHCSFGEFQKKQFMTVTRISLDRNNKISSEGSIVNVECVKERSEFNFEIILFENMMTFENEIKEAVEYVGKYFGIGKFRSIGFGRFNVIKVITEDLTHFLEYDNHNYIDSNLISVFKTPFIFNIKSMNENILIEEICRSIYERYCEIIQEKVDRKIKIRNLVVEMKPEFIHRYSLEQAKIENRLVMEAGSIFKYQIDNNKIQEQIQIASRFGIGEWRNCGFGRFDFTNSKKN